MVMVKANIFYSILSIGIFLAFIIAKINVFALHSMRVWADTQSYLSIAQAPWLSEQFWGAGRPLSVPMFYKLLGLDLQAIIQFQLGFAICAWGILGFTVIRYLHQGWLKLISLGIILALGLSRDISQWDTVVLTESISSSLFVLAVSAWYWAIESWNSKGQSTFRRTALAVILVFAMLVWSFARDTNMYFSLTIGIIMVAGIIFPKIRHHPSKWQYVFVSISLITIFILQNQTADIGTRSRFPLLNLIGQRILPKPDRVAFFAEHGMPANQVVPRLVNKWGGDFTGAGKEIEQFFLWVNSVGKATYIEYLITHPFEVSSEPLENWSILLSPSSYIYHYGDPEKKGQLFPIWFLGLTEIVFPHPLSVVVFAIGTIVLVATILAVLRRAQIEWLVPVMLLLLVYPMMFVVWHGDAMEVERHAFPVYLQLRLAGWMLLIFVLDQLFDKNKSRFFHISSVSDYPQRTI